MKKYIQSVILMVLVLLPCISGMAEIDHTEMFYVHSTTNTSYNENYEASYTLSAFSKEAPNGMDLTAPASVVIKDEICEDGVVSYQDLNSVYYISSGDVFVPYVADGHTEQIVRLISSDNIRYGTPGFYYSNEEDGTEIIYGYLSAAAFSDNDVVYSIAAMPGSTEEALCTVNESDFSDTVFLVDITDYMAEISAYENLAAVCVAAGNAWVEDGVTQADGYGYYLYAKRVNGSISGAVVYKVNCASFVSDVKREGQIQSMGYCGENAKWTLSYDGVLQIEGTGAMDAALCRWDSLKDKMISVEIGDGVTEIANDAFSSAAVQKVSIGTDVKKIGDRAFSDCVQLQEAELPASVAFLGEEVFRGTHSLKSLRVASTSTAFVAEGNVLYNKNKSVLYHVSAGYKENVLAIPSVVCEIKTGALADALAISAFSSLSQSFYADDGVLYTADKKTLIRYPASKTEDSYTVLPSTESIAPYAFYRLSCLKGVALAAVTVNVGDFAFAQAPSLRGISLPSGVNLGEAAFDESGLLLVDYTGTAATWRNVLKKDTSGVLSDCLVRYGEDLALPLFYAGVISKTQANEIGATPFVVLTDNGASKKIMYEKADVLSLGKLCLAICNADGSVAEMFYPTVKAKTHKMQAKGILLGEREQAYELRSSYTPSEDIGFTFGEKSLLVPENAMFFFNGEEIAPCDFTTALQTASETLGYVTAYASRGRVYSVQIISPTYTGIVEAVTQSGTKYTVTAYTEKATSEWIWDTAEKNVIFVYNDRIVSGNFIEPDMTFAVAQNDQTVWVYLSDMVYTGASTSQFDGLAFLYNKDQYVTFFYDCTMTTYEDAVFYVNPFGVIIYQGELQKEAEVFMGYLWDIEDGVFILLSKTGAWEYISFANDITVYHNNQCVTYTSREEMLEGLFDQTGGAMSYTSEKGFLGRDVILYTIAEGEINSFTIPVGGKDSDAYMRKKEEYGVWDRETGMLASDYVSASTVVFGVVGDGADRTDYVVLPQAQLHDGEAYHCTGYIYGGTNNGKLDCVLLQLEGTTPVYSVEKESVELLWTGKDDLPTRVFRAEYDADGRMLGLESVDKILIHGNNSISVGASSAQAENEKLFIWDKTMTPFMQAIDILER